MAEVLEQEPPREHGGKGIGHPFPGQGRGRAVDWLEQGVRLAGMEVGARRDPQPAYQPGAEVGQDIAVEVVRYNDLEALRLTHHLQRQGVYVPMLGGDGLVFLRDALEAILPNPVRGNRVRLVAHRHARLAMRLRPLEGGADDPLYALAGVDLLGDVLVPARAAAA